MVIVIVNVIVIALFSILVSPIESYNILATFPFPAKSHYAAVDNLLVELARRGHNVTVYSPYSKAKKIPNYTHVDVSDCFPTDESITPETVTALSDTFTCLYVLFLMSPTYENITSCQPLMDLVHSPTTNSNNGQPRYDLFMTETFNTDLFLLYAYKFRIPFVTTVPNVLFPWLSERLGNPYNPSYIPHMTEGFLSNMNFWQRLRNTYANLLSLVMYEYLQRPKEDEIARKLLGPDTPSLRDIAKNTSLILTYTNPALHSGRPLVPSVIEMSGIHINPTPSPIPKDIETFINESEHGVVYFCMGSLLRGSSFPEEKRNAFLYAFSKIPQRVLWKWEGDELPGKSDKIMTSKWMPQRDILAHPKVKLFISHGGLLGTNEAVYEGVPILGIPIFGDQRTNVRSIEASGAGEMLDYNEISNEVVLEKIQRLINYPKYRENAEQLSRRYRDRPMPPLDTAVYWTEYVIRHKGAPHLRSPAVDMPWYQYLLLDVIAFVIFVLVATLVVIYYVLKFTLRILLRILFRIFTRKPNVSKTSKKVD